MENEKSTEKYLRDEIKKMGGKAYKFVSPGNVGVPDRLVCLPGGRAVFVELKSEGMHSTATQKRQQEKLRDLGFEVYADIDTRENVDDLVRALGDNTAIGDRIRERREALGISQADLAKMVGYKSRSSINKIENSTNGIPSSKISLFSKALNTTVSYLVGGIEK